MGSRQDGRDPPSPREVAHNVKRANEIGLAWSVPRIIAIAAVLGVARRDGETCAKPLFEWATMMLAMDLLRAPLRLWVLARLRVLQRIGMAGDPLEELTPEFQAKLQLILRSRVAGLNRGLSIAALALNAAGVVWLLQAGGVRQDRAAPVPAVPRAHAHARHLRRPERLLHHGVLQPGVRLPLLRPAHHPVEWRRGGARCWAGEDWPAP